MNMAYISTKLNYPRLHIHGGPSVFYPMVQVQVLRLSAAKQSLILSLSRDFKLHEHVRMSCKNIHIHTIIITTGTLFPLLSAW